MFNNSISQNNTSSSGLPSTRTISIFNLRGGVGKTTIAVNLAAALTQLWQIDVGLLDMAMDTSHCALMLDLKSTTSLASLSNWPESQISQDVADELLPRHPSGVSLLTGADTPTEMELVMPEMLNLIWPHVTSRFKYIVVDAGNHFNDMTFALLDRSDIILLPFAPDLASIKSLNDAKQVFTEIGYDLGRVFQIANWTFPGSPLLLTRIKQKLNIDVTAEIPYDGGAFVQAINTGRPPVLESRDSPVVDAIFKLAYKLTAQEMEGTKSANPSPWLVKARNLLQQSS